MAVLNAVIGVLAAVCIGTGLALWLEWSDAEFWSVTHTLTGFLSIVVIFIHLWRNRSRIHQLAGVRSDDNQSSRHGGGRAKSDRSVSNVAI